jgi:hypothetical protein
MRGRFYRPNVQLNVPIYLDDDIAEFVQRYAKQKKVDAQTVVNEILRGNKGNTAKLAIVTLSELVP